jgi:hypothetical protein
VAAFVAALRARSVSPHIAIDGHVRVTGKPRKTSVDGRVTRHSGYAISQRCRKRIEEMFGWIKGAAGLAEIKLRGVSVSMLPLLWPWSLKISSGCPSSWRRPHEHPGQVAVVLPGYDMAIASACISFGQACGDGWAELQEDGALKAEISLDNGDDIPVIARRSTTSSTAC